MKDEQENLINGMDVEAWVNEGVVDTLIPYTSAPNLSGMAAGWTNRTTRSGSWTSPVASL